MGAQILIVEDNPTIAWDIAMNLEAHDYFVVNVAHSFEDALKCLESKNKIDLVMVDINLNGEKSGIDLAKLLDYQYGIPFIYLTSYADEDTLNKAAETFPASYLVKPFKERDLAPAVKMALTRKKSQKVQRMPSLKVINSHKIAKISKGEYRVIEKIWLGKTNAEISELLFISINTVKTHIRNVYSKLHVHSKTEIIKYLREFK